MMAAPVIMYKKICNQERKTIVKTILVPGFNGKEKIFIDDAFTFIMQKVVKSNTKNKDFPLPHVWYVESFNYVLQCNLNM